MNVPNLASLLTTRVIEAIGAGQPDSALARVLAVLRELIGADAAITLRKADSITALVLASSPEDVLPTGMTHAAALESAFTAQRPVYDAPAKLDLRGKRDDRAIMAIVPWLDARMIGATVLVRHQGNPFSAEERAAIESITGVLHCLALLRHKIAVAGAMRGRFDAIFRTIPSGIVFVDEDGAEAWVNHAAGRVLGMAPGAVEPVRVARAMSALWARAERPDELRKIMLEVMTDVHRELRDLQWSFVGSERSVYSISTFPTGQEDYRGRLWLLVDVTQQQLNREELEAKNRALEVARREADQANAAKSRFLATMSHEIRTPMNGVLGMTGLLLDSHLESAQRDLVETIRSSGDALLTIINDILDFSKIEAGLMDLENQPFVIRQCLDDVLDLMAPHARKKSLELGVLVDATVPTAIYGDVTRLRQVLVNLMGNAVKFTAAGEVVIEATVIESPENNERLLHFSVRDTGIGIPSDRVDRLFQSFSQGDSTINRKYGGTGLGLAICKRLVELMGGTIWVERMQGEGTTFHFTIAMVPAQSSVGDISEALATAGRDLRGKHVLIVDDNATNRRLLSAQTLSFGLTPTVVASGQEALEVLRERHGMTGSNSTPFSLALIDVNMPGMNGIELGHAIRNKLHLTALPLVFVSSTDLVTHQELAALHASFLTKPIKQSNLFDVIMRSLSYVFVRVSRVPPPIQFDAAMAQRIPLRILLAEDNAVNQKVAQLILGKLGYRADVAANGFEVLDALTKRPYDVILMDVHMPEMDGLEATRRLRERGPWQTNPRIIAMTADVLQEGREACAVAGMDDFVSKPIRLQELINALERCTMLTANDPVASNSSTIRFPSHIPEEPIIDDEVFGNLRLVCDLGGTGTLAALVTDFLSDSMRLLDEMRVAIASENWDTLERLAHTLKGTSGMFGAKILARRFEYLERAARERYAGPFDELLDAANHERTRVQDALVQRCAV